MTARGGARPFPPPAGRRHASSRFAQRLWALGGHTPQCCAPRRSLEQGRPDSGPQGGPTPRPASLASHPRPQAWLPTPSCPPRAWGDYYQIDAREHAALLNSNHEEEILQRVLGWLLCSPSRRSAAEPQRRRHMDPTCRLLPLGLLGPPPCPPFPQVLALSRLRHSRPRTTPRTSRTVQEGDISSSPWGQILLLAPRDLLGCSNPSAGQLAGETEEKAAGPQGLAPQGAGGAETHEPPEPGSRRPAATSTLAPSLTGPQEQASPSRPGLAALFHTCKTFLGERETNSPLARPTGYGQGDPEDPGPRSPRKALPPREAWFPSLHRRGRGQVPAACTANPLSCVCGPQLLSTSGCSFNIPYTLGFSRRPFAGKSSLRNLEES